MVSGERRVCSGQVLAQAGLLQTLRQSTVRGAEWELDGQTIALEGGALCCKTFPRTYTLRRSDGRRLAFWLWHAGGWEGVLREGLREDAVPVILGMVLAAGHDFWGSSLGD